MRRANVLRWTAPIAALVLSVVIWKVLGSSKIVPPLSRRVFAQGYDPAISGYWDPNVRQRRF